MLYESFNEVAELQSLLSDRYESPDKQTEDPDEGAYEHGGYYQGSYCRKSSQRQSVEREKKWDPRPSKGILIKKGWLLYFS